MQLLSLHSSDDLISHLQTLTIDFTRRNGTAKGGLEIELADDLDSVLRDQTAGKSAPFQIVILDGSQSTGEVKILRAFDPALKILTFQPGIKDTILLKHPLAGGELSAILSELLDSISLRQAQKNCFFNDGNAYVFLNRDFSILEANPKALEYAGVAVLNDLLGRSIWDVFPMLEEYKINFHKAAQKQEKSVLETLRTEEKNNPGQLCYYQAELMPLQDSGMLVRLIDRTLAFKKDEHLRHAQKMESVANLAAGLAHDFNNVISGIEGTVSSIKFSVESAGDLAGFADETREDFTILDDSLVRGKEIIKELMLLSTNKETPKRIFDLNSLIKRVADVCRNSFPAHVVLQTEPYTGGCATVNGYFTQIEQVLLNLCINANHAMTIMRDKTEEQGGELVISVTPIEVGRNICSVIPTATEGRYWLLSVSDTGIGIAPEIRNKIFEPFFTVKPEGTGNGLGLPMVYNIVHKHEGFLDFFSSPGQGTTFMVFLPDAGK